MAMERANLPYLQVYASDFHARDTELEQGLAALMPEGRKHRICSAGDLSSQMKLGDVDFVLSLLLAPSLLDGLADAVLAARTAGRNTSLIIAITQRSEEHTSELQSLMRNSYAVFCLKKKKNTNNT